MFTSFITLVVTIAYGVHCLFIGLPLVKDSLLLEYNLTKRFCNLWFTFLILFAFGFSFVVPYLERVGVSDFWLFFMWNGSFFAIMVLLDSWVFHRVSKARKIQVTN